MSQASTWGVQSAGPATMAQYAARDNAALDALLSGHRGTSRPSYAVAGTLWVKAGTAPVTNAEIYYFDGTNDILVATVNESTNAITFATLGSAAVQNVGTSANNVVQLNGSAQLPAVSGVLLTGFGDAAYEDVAVGGVGDLLRSDGSAANLTDLPGAGELFHIQDQKGATTDGGTATSGSWQTRTLNTVLTNEITDASLVSNQFILPAGTYYIEGDAPAFRSDSHVIRIQNITDTTTTITGTSEFSGSAGNYAQTRSFVRGQFTIDGTKTFELQHRVETTTGANGYGEQPGFTTAVYSDIRIRKI